MTNEVRLRVRADTAEATRNLTTLKTIAGGVFAGGLLAAGSVQATAAIGGLINAGIDFESAFAGVRKTVNATETELEALRRGIREMAKELPASANEIAGVAEAAGQLGIQTDAILGFSRTMIDLGETTNLTATEAATALARLANVMGTSQQDFDRLGSAVVELGNNMATTEREIVEFAQRISGAGEIAGLAESDVLAIGAAFSSAGIEAEAGGTAIQKVLLAMTEAVATGNQDLRTFAATSQMTVEEFRRSFESDAAGAFVSFVEGLGVAGDDAFQVLERLGLQDQRLIRSFLSVANAQGLLRESVDLSRGAWDENIALTAEAEKRYETTAAQIEIFKNNVDDLAISLSESLLPALNDVLPLLTAAASFMGSFQERVDKGAEKGFLGLPSMNDLYRGIGLMPDLTPDVAAVEEAIRAFQQTTDEIFALAGAARQATVETEEFAAGMGRAVSFAVGLVGGFRGLERQIELAMGGGSFMDRLGRIVDSSLNVIQEETDARREMAVEVRTFADRMGAAQSALFGSGTREETELQLRIARLDQQILGAAGGTPELERQREVARRQLELMEGENRIQQLRVELADRSLLTEAQQNSMTEVLIERTRTMTGEMELANTALGRFAAALGVAASSFELGAASERRPRFVYATGADGHTVGVPGSFAGYAMGTPYVPSDGVYMLHRGERVMTASDNRNFSRKSVRIGTLNVYQGGPRRQTVEETLALARI